MPFQRPTLKQLKERIVTDIETSIESETSLLRKSVLRVLGYVFAGAVHLVYGYLSWLALQLFVETAEGSFLDIHSSIWGVNRKAASFAEYPITITGTEGSVVLAGSIVLGPNNIDYEVDESVTIPVSGTITATVIAAQSGSAANLDPGAVLTFVNPIAGVESSVTLGDGIDGVDEESDDSLRERILLRIQEPARGGAKADYIFWAREIAGVTRAWCYPLVYGPGTVGVSFVTDDSDPIIPSPAKVAEVQAHIDEVKPVGAEAYVFAPVLLPIDHTLSIDPDTPETRAAIEAELDAFYRRDGYPGNTIKLSNIREAISGAPGEVSHELFEPSADIELTNLQIAVRGTMTYV